jgi:4,5-dihydroxyphthalate decarboxylase
MSAAVPLTIAALQSAAHAPLFNGSLDILGYRITPFPLSSGEMYSRVFDEPRIDVAEMSISRYVGLLADGKSRFVALPYYFGRKFQHSTLYARSTFRGGPQDIRGLRIGMAEYDHTGHTWARALLEDEYGVGSSDVTWVIARREKTSAPLSHPFEAPPSVRVEYAAPEKFIAQMLLDGEIDVLVNPRPPSCFVEHPDKVRRLIENHGDVERRYFAKTGICPIMHVLGVRKELLDRHPDLAETLPETLKRSFGATRKIWSTDDEAATPSVRLFGLAAEERASLETFLRHYHKQGMSRRQMTLDEFFAP